MCVWCHSDLQPATESSYDAMMPCLSSGRSNREEKKVYLDNNTLPLCYPATCINIDIDIDIDHRTLLRTSLLFFTPLLSPLSFTPYTCLADSGMLV
jgi:hypothetical protein